MENLVSLNQLSWEAEHLDYGHCMQLNEIRDQMHQTILEELGPLSKRVAELEGIAPLPSPEEFVGPEKSHASAWQHKKERLMEFCRQAELEIGYKCWQRRTRSVLVLPGSDLAMNDAVMDALARFGLEERVLWKFKPTGPEHGDWMLMREFGFVVFLLAPDDFGTDERPGPQTRRRHMRQALLFLLGQSAGSSGNKGVLVLYRCPQGFCSRLGCGEAVITEFDKAGSWRAELQEELMKAGIL